MFQQVAQVASIRKHSLVLLGCFEGCRPAAVSRLVLQLQAGTTAASCSSNNRSENTPERLARQSANYPW